MPDSFDFSSLTDEEIIDLYINFERQRYALNVEIGRRGIGPQVDAEADKHFRRASKFYRDPGDSIHFQGASKELNKEEFDELMDELMNEL